MMARFVFNIAIVFDCILIRRSDQPPDESLGLLWNSRWLGFQVSKVYSTAIVILVSLTPVGPTAVNVYVVVVFG